MLTLPPAQVLLGTLARQWQELEFELDKFRSQESYAYISTATRESGIQERLRQLQCEEAAIRVDTASMLALEARWRFAAFRLQLDTSNLLTLKDWQAMSSNSMHLPATSALEGLKQRFDW